MINEFFTELWYHGLGMYTANKQLRDRLRDQVLEIGRASCRERV